MMDDNIATYAVYGIYCRLSEIPPMPFDVWVAETAGARNVEFIPDWDTFRVYQRAGGKDLYHIWLFRRYGVNQ